MLISHVYSLPHSFLSPRFFVVEDHVLHTTQGLVNRAYVEELWELALSKIVAALRTHSVRFNTHLVHVNNMFSQMYNLLLVVITPLFPQSYCDDPDLVLDLKNLIVLFADTLQVCVCVLLFVQPWSASHCMN